MGGIMGPDFPLIVVIAVAIAALPLIILGVTITLLHRQRGSHDDLSRRLNRLERQAERSQELLQQIARGAKEKEIGLPPAPRLPPPARRRNRS